MQNKITDEQLIRNFQNGDEKSYAILVNKYRDRIKNFIIGFLKDEVAAEDLTQDTMFKFYQKKDSYKEIAKFLDIDLKKRPSELLCEDYYKMTEHYEKYIKL